MSHDTNYIQFSDPSTDDTKFLLLQRSSEEMVTQFATLLVQRHNFSVIELVLTSDYVRKANSNVDNLITLTDDYVLKYRTTIFRIFRKIQR